MNLDTWFRPNNAPHAVAAADLPAGDPSYAAWRESARGFLDPANQTSTTGTYAITREPGS